MFLLFYVTSTPAIFFNFQVKRDGRESNRATNLSPPPRLKMTDITQNQQTTEKSRVYIILPPSPKGKNIARWGKVENVIFYRLEKIIHPPPYPKKNYPPKKTSPVQSIVQSCFSICPKNNTSLHVILQPCHPGVHFLKIIEWSLSTLTRKMLANLLFW